MASSYPGAPDVLPRLVDEFDRPRASWWARLFDGLVAVETELGTDPTSLGAAWSTFADIAALLLEFSRMEAGTFTVDYPEDDPVEVKLQHPERFTDENKMIVFLFKNTTSKGRRIAENFRWNTVITTDGGGDPDGFQLWRRNMSGFTDNFTEEWFYLAIEENY